MGDFRFKGFSLTQDRCALRLGTDAVLLGAAMSLPQRGLSLALDVGTGCGVIALMVAQRLSSLGAALPRISGIDIDPPSIEDAGANFAASPWSSSLEARLVPLQDYRPDGTIDLIFSNPPFFDNSLRNPDPRLSAARHSTSLSVRDIIIFASEHLPEGGQLSMILPSGGVPAAVREGASFGLGTFRLLEIRANERKPFTRAVVEMRKTAGCVQTVRETLTLMSGMERSEEYARLTRDFYL